MQLAGTQVPQLRYRLFQLFKYRRVLQSGYILSYFLIPCERTQQPAHDFAGPGFRQVIPKADFIRFGNGTDLLRYPIAQFLDNAISIGLVIGCAGYLFFAMRPVYGAKGFTRILKSLLLVVAAVAIFLGYRFALFLLTLYTTP